MTNTIVIYNSVHDLFFMIDDLFFVDDVMIGKFKFVTVFWRLNCPFRLKTQTHFQSS